MCRGSTAPGSSTAVGSGKIFSRSSDRASASRENIPLVLARAAPKSDAPRFPFGRPGRACCGCFGELLRGSRGSARRGRRGGLVRSTCAGEGGEVQVEVAGLVGRVHHALDDGELHFLIGLDVHLTL